MQKRANVSYLLRTTNPREISLRSTIVLLIGGSTISALFNFGDYCILGCLAIAFTMAATFFPLCRMKCIHCHKAISARKWGANPGPLLFLWLPFIKEPCPHCNETI